MPSETASRASPRYRRTLGTWSTSRSSRQSRIASAISVGVISSSPAPSATALIKAIAFRIRSAAARPGMGRRLLCRRLAEPDHDPPLGFLADARAGDFGVPVQRQVDRPPLEGLYSIKGDRITCHLHLARSAQSNLAHRVLAALPITLDVDDDPLAFAEMPADHHVGHRLQRTEGFATPADQCAKVSSADIESHRLGAHTRGHLGAYAHVLQQALDQGPRHLGFS